MIKTEYKQVYETFNRVFGTDAQYRICIEEMAELTKELCHLMRLERTGTSLEVLKKIDKTKQKIIEETADVLNVAEAIQLLFGEEEIERIRIEKMQRTLSRIKES